MPSLSSQLKFILKDKTFAPKQFITNSFAEFLNLVLEFISIQSESPQNGRNKSKKDKEIEKIFNKIFSSFSKIFPYLTESTILHNASTLNTIFSILMHPLSPESIRTTALNLLLQLIVLVDEPNLDLFHDSLTFMIPYNRFSRDPEEEQSLISLFQNVKHIYNPDPSTSTLESAESQLNLILKFINNNWSAFPRTCVHILSKYILSITYHSIAESCPKCALDVGFKSPPPETFVSQLYYFVNQFNDIKNDILPISQSSAILSIFIYFFEATIPTLNKRDLIAILTFLTSLVKIKELFNDSMDKAIKIIKIFIQILEDPDPENKVVITVAERFVTTFFDSIFSLQNIQQISEFFVFIFKEYSSKSVSVSFLFCFLLQFITIRQIDLKDLIHILINNNTLYLSIAVHFSQIFAVESFLTMFEMQIDELFEYCDKYLQLKKNEHIINHKNDWLYSNLRNIFNESNLKPIPQISLKIQKFETFQKELSFISIPRITECNKTMINYYISLFDDMSNENFCFPLLSYFYSLVKLNVWPMEIEQNEYNLILYSFEYLINVITYQKNEISFISFNILYKLITKLSYKNCFDINSLTKLYSIVIEMLLNQNEEIRYKAFKASIKFIKNSFSGSQFLIPILICLIEKEKIKLTNLIIGFITSYPLFIKTFYFPEDFINDVKSMLNDEKDQLINDYEYVLDYKNENLFDAVIEILNKISFKEFPLIIHSYVQLISFVLLSNNKVNNYIINSFDRIIEGINQKSDIVLYALLSSLPLFHSISELYQTETSDFIEKIVRLCLVLKNIENINWYNTFLLYCSSLLIYNYNLIYKSKVYEIFLNFLMENKENKNQKFELSLLLLTSQFGLYPFNQIFDAETKNVFLTQFGNYYIPSKDGLMCLSDSGIFSWEFKPFKSDEKILPNIFEDLETIKLTDEFVPDFQQNFTRPLAEVMNIINLRSDLTNSLHSFPLINEIMASLKSIESSYEKVMRQVSDPVNVVEMSEISPLQPSTPMTLLGILDPLEPETLLSLPKNQETKEFLKSFQDNLSKKHLKVGLLFTDENHSKQSDLLTMTLEETSPRFQEFLVSLGNLTVMKSGYDSFTSNDSKLNVLLYSDLLYEISFQTPTLFKPTFDDPYKIKKMNLILENPIVIVWIESGRGFNENIFLSNSNKYYILVYPLENGLFRVDLTSTGKAMVKTQIVLKRMLTFFVRTIIIFINEFISPQTHKMEKPNHPEAKAQTLCQTYIDICY